MNLLSYNEYNKSNDSITINPARVEMVISNEDDIGCWIKFSDSSLIHLRQSYGQVITDLRIIKV